MQTLSYGYKLPEDGDRGNIFFPGLEDNIQRLNDHTHNGSNSSLLTAASSVATTQTVSAASWVAYGSDGYYRQLVTMPTGIAFETHAIEFRISGGTFDGHVFYPNIEKVSATTFYVYINDNTQTIKAIYT